MGTSIAYAAATTNATPSRNTSPAGLDRRATGAAFGGIPVGTLRYNNARARAPASPNPTNTTRHPSTMPSRKTAPAPATVPTLAPVVDAVTSLPNSRAREPSRPRSASSARVPTQKRALPTPAAMRDAKSSGRVKEAAQRIAESAYANAPARMNGRRPRRSAAKPTRGRANTPTSPNAVNRAPTWKADAPSSRPYSGRYTPMTPNGNAIRKTAHSAPVSSLRYSRIFRRRNSRMFWLTL